MKERIAIVGAGIMGRLIAWRLAKLGFATELFEARKDADQLSCSFAAAGMLAPFSELVQAEPMIATLGWQALAKWRSIGAELGGDPGLCFGGTLVVSRKNASPEFNADLHDFAAKLKRSAALAEVPQGDFMQEIGPVQIASLCPGLEDSCDDGLMIPAEGWVTPAKVMQSLLAATQEWGTICHFNDRVLQLKQGQILTSRGPLTFDQVIDCRGLCARDAFPDLRGVRGECLLLHAPEFILTSSLRLLHHRYPIYIVPRGEGTFLIGATTIESDDDGPIAVKSVLELLNPLFRLHPAFHYAKLLAQQTGVRPAFSNNLPQITAEPGLLRVNGLYRHGYLLSPIMADAVVQYLTHSPRQPQLEVPLGDIKRRKDCDLGEWQEADHSSAYIR